MDHQGALLQLPVAELTRRAGQISWILLDVDGVLTDGRLYYGPTGEIIKAFHVKDGYGVRLARQAGIKVGSLSSRADAAFARRAADLAFDLVMEGARDKSTAFEGFLAGKGIAPEAVAYAGDDLPDLPVLSRVGLALCPADAAPEVRQAAHVVLAKNGGQGAVRELVELLLGWRG
ncbi:MAG TPA: HAD hydrolase family protein [Thermoanaerobaculia bacterium]|nr:HAD hydrolase family protein [Thermoanaerobaculia bacterium]